MAKSKEVHNMRDNAKRYLAALIVKQKDEIQRLTKWKGNLEKEYEIALKLHDRMENHPLYEKQGEKVKNIGQKIEALEEAIAQYQANLIEMGVNN